MINKSNLAVKFIAEDDRQHLGGWQCYCSFYEIKDSNGNCLAKISEDLGEVIRPFNSEWCFQRSYRNHVIPLSLLEVHNDYILIQIHNLHETVKKLYYK